MNIYLRRYFKLIRHYKNNPANGYTELHHIKPRCLGGKDHSSNLIALPAKAHYLAHWMLTKIYTNNRFHKLNHAFSMMAVIREGQQRNYTAIQYAKMAEAKRNIYPKHYRDCVECGQSFQLRKPSAKQVTCGRSCAGKLRLKNRIIEGGSLQGPNWGKKTVEERICIICSSTFKIQPSRPTKTCSRSCASTMRNYERAARPGGYGPRS